MSVTMTEKPKRKRKSNAGRKPLDGKNLKDVVSKLEHAFSFGATDVQACLYADISRATLFRLEEANPEFRDRKEMLKQNLQMKAKKEVLDGLKKNPELALKVLERLDKTTWAPLKPSDKSTVIEDNRQVHLHNHTHLHQKAMELGRKYTSELEAEYYKTIKDEQKKVSGDSGLHTSGSDGEAEENKDGDRARGSKEGQSGSGESD